MWDVGAQFSLIDAPCCYGTIIHFTRASGVITVRPSAQVTVHPMKMIFDYTSFEYNGIAGSECVPPAALENGWPECFWVILGLPHMIRIDEWSVLQFRRSRTRTTSTSANAARPMSGDQMYIDRNSDSSNTGSP